MVVKVTEIENEVLQVEQLLLRGRNSQTVASDGMAEVECRKELMELRGQGAD